jgi:hypothetical protein
VRVPPPICSSASITVTATPRLARTAAQASPFGPEPTIIALLIPPIFLAQRSCTAASSRWSWKWPSPKL